MRSEERRDAVITWILEQNTQSIYIVRLHTKKKNDHGIDLSDRME